MSESFKQQCVPGEVPSVIREDHPRPLLGRPDDAVTPSGLSPLGVDGTDFEVNVPSSEPINDLPLDAGSGHKGLHCPLPATESADQSLSLYAGKPNLPRSVWLRGGYILDRVMRKYIEFYEMVGKDTKGCPIPDFCAPAAWEALEEKGDVALGEVFCAESLSFGDHAPDLTDVLGIYIPFADKGRDIYLLEAVNERGETVRFVSNEQVRKGSALQYDQFQRLPMESPLEGANHLLDRARGLVVRCPAGLRSAPLVGEVEPGLVDRAAFATEGHLDAGDAPVDAPVSSTRDYGWGVTLYPGRESNPHDPSGPRNFEFLDNNNNSNDLERSPSESPINDDQPASGKRNDGVPR